MQMKVGWDTGGVGESPGNIWIARRLACGKRTQISYLFPSVLAATGHECDLGGFKDGSEERQIQLPADQGHGAACVPASIDE